MSANPTREDTHLLTLVIDGKDLGIWDKKEGGEIDSEENKYKPGNMASEISLGGTKTIGNTTFRRLFDWSRDDPLLPWLYPRVGNGRGALGVQMLDIAGNPKGNLMTLGGTLKTLTPPDLDSESNDPALISLEFTCDTVAFS
jgi:hypothetical protein